MRSKKIFTILRTFSDAEWRACYKYLKYCNQKQSKSLQIFELLYNYRKKSLTTPQLHDKIVAKIFEDLNEKTFLNRLSDLTKDVEDFLVIQTIKDSNHTYSYYKTLGHAYAQKGLYNYFEQSVYKSKKALDSENTIDLFDALRYMEVNHSLYFSDLYDGHNKPFEALQKADKNRQLFSNNLKLFYEIEEQNINKLFNQSTEEHPYQSDILNNILSHLKDLQANRIDESYMFLLEKLQSSEQPLSKELRSVILLSLINYCILELKAGNNDMVDRTANLYFFGMNNDLLLQHGKISEIRFLNIIDFLANSNLEFEVNSLIGQWIDKVNTKDKMSIYNMALAIFSFAQERYGAAIEILNVEEIKLNRINITQRARWMQICALCSLYPDHEEKQEVLKAAQTFFKRHKTEMNAHTFAASINLIEIIRLIWNKRSATVIKKFVDDCEFLVMRTWISKMIKISGTD